MQRYAAKSAAVACLMQSCKGSFCLLVLVVFQGTVTSPQAQRAERFSVFCMQYLASHCLGSSWQALGTS